MSKSQPSLSALLKKIAPKAGVKLILEPKFGHVGQIICPNGKKRYFRDNNFDLNLIGSSGIASDKGYASYFMSKMGYPTIEGRTFYSEKLCKVLKSNEGIERAFQYAKQLGFPVIVKPNSKSQGECVYKVINKEEFYNACRQVFKCDRVVLVQRFISGKDYRIVVLDDEVISAYQRLPLTVTGDGVHTILKLLQTKQSEFYSRGRKTKIKANDYRIKMFLDNQNMKMNTILQKNQNCQLLANANLSSGGEALNVTSTIHKDFKKIAIKLTGDMGLRYCGVDLMVKGDINNAPNKYWVIEINSAPGLDNYYSIGKEQSKIVEELYLKVLIAIAKQ